VVDGSGERDPAGDGPVSRVEARSARKGIEWDEASVR